MKFNKEEQEKLLQNKNVLAVTGNCVYYTTEFKEQAIQEYYQGKSARQWSKNKMTPVECRDFLLAS